MPTVQQVALAALRDVGVDVGLLNAAAWVQERYEELTSRRMKHLQRHASVSIPAVLATGTVTHTLGSTTVTGDAAARATWSSAVVGRYFQTRNVWAKIASINGTPALTLDVASTEETVTGAAYRIVQRYATLPTDVQYLSGYFVHQRRRRPVYVGGMPELEILQPDRLYRVGGPEYIAESGVNTTTRARQIEVYPYSTQAEVLEFRYWAKPTTYALTDELPSFITTNELKEGVLIDVMRWKMAEALRKNDKDGAAHWRNEYRAQETRWASKSLPALIKRDQAIEDLGLVMRAPGGARREVRTARDEVYVRGARP